MIQEPENNIWMPLHWGLPGGKPTETESLQETLERKIKTDIGQVVDVVGLFRVEELLTKGKTVFMYIVIAKCKSSQVNGEAKSYRWVSREDIKKMKTEEFTEFYNKKLLMEYFRNPEKALPFNLLNTLEYYKMNSNLKYQKWLKSR